eukprot:8505221-Heterocapsa_arctica.AAC.1
MITLLDLLKELFGDGYAEEARRLPLFPDKAGLPLYPDKAGGVLSKQSTTAAIREAAASSGEPLTRPDGLGHQ